MSSMKTMQAAAAAGFLAASMAFGAFAATTVTPTDTTNLSAADSEYKAAVKKAKDERAAAFAACDKGAKEERSNCKKVAKNAYKKAEADARAAQKKAVAESKGKKAS